MLLAIIVIVGFGLLGYYVWGYRDTSDAVLGGLLGLVSCFIILPAAWGLTCVCDADYWAVDTTTTNIIALNDNYSSYIYRYSHNSELKYTYLYQDGDKGIANNTIPAENSYINYIAEGENPHIITKCVNYKNLVINAFLWPIGMHNEYYIYVPEGSIVTEGQYQIDLE